MRTGKRLMGKLNPGLCSFTAERGFTDQVTLPDVPQKLDFLNLMFPPERYTSITDMTNKYAEDYFTAHPKEDLPRAPRLRNWYPVTEPEMKAFLALPIAMGIVNQQDIQDYWSLDELHETPFFRSIMPRDRFLLIFKFLHLSDIDDYKPRDHPNYDPFHKLGVFYTTIIHQFEAIWSPGRQICIDEGMVPFRGNIHFRTYNPDKPDKYGLKAYELCDSSNSYCCRFELYGGKGKEPSAKGLTYDNVSRLMEPYVQTGHTLYCDNYYTSPQLFLDLSDANVNTCGTMRNRKGIPNAFKDATLTTPQQKFCMANGPLLAMKNKDRRDVKMLTTAHKLVGTGKHTHDGEEKRKPDCINQYNKYMGAGDTSDQMVAYMSFRRRTLKWWKKAFFHIYSLTICNGYILHKEHFKATNRDPNKTAALHKVFRREIVKELITSSGYAKVKRRSLGASGANLQRLTASAGHYLEEIPKTKEGGAVPQKVCLVCNSALRQKAESQNLPEPKSKWYRRRSRYQCKQCKVTLCMTTCMEIYHTKEHYIQAYLNNHDAKQSVSVTRLFFLLVFICIILMFQDFSATLKSW